MSRKNMARKADKHMLYQESVQGVEFELDYLDKVFRETRSRTPRVLREDFCGTALSACEWVRRHKSNHAIGIDLDKATLDWARKHNVTALDDSQAARLDLLQEDVAEAKTDAVDVCTAFNYSYWIFRTRAGLKRYFENVLRNLAGDGIFFLDVFGGYEAHQTQEEEREQEGFTYIWDQASFNPITNEMQCYIHFEFPDGSRLKRAFDYRWRLWGAQEVRDLLEEVGFRRTSVHMQAFDEKTDEPLDEYYETEEAEDYATYLGYIVAEK